MNESINIPVHITVDFEHYRTFGKELAIIDALYAFKEDLEFYLKNTTYCNCVYFKDKNTNNGLCIELDIININSVNILILSICKNNATFKSLLEASCCILNILDKYPKFKYLCFQKEEICKLVVYRGIASAV